MSSEKEKEAFAGTEDEKTALKDADASADGSLPGMDDSYNDNDNSRARFIANNHEKGDADGAAVPEVYVDVEGKTKIENQFVGLSKEELMKYADDPYWKKVRLALLILFWVGWFGMLVAAIIIIVLAPKCPPRPKLDWWQKGSCYQLHTESFKDSNGDGIGDIKGVHDSLNYLQGKPDSLNVSSLWLSSIYPHSATGSGITDFKAIKTELGTLEEFDSFKVSLHKRNLKLILDFIPNHTDKTHPWFVKSQKKEEGYEDFYVWAAGSGSNTPPNDWKNQLGGPAWVYDVTRGEYYYNSFGEDKPDLNLRDQKVLEEIDGVLDFWLGRGVDGFVINNAAFLVECEDLTEGESCVLFQPETYELITRFREQLDARTDKDDKIRFLLVDAPKGTGNQTTDFYTAGANMVTNTALLDIEAGCGTQCLYELINEAASDTAWNSWQTGNQDTSRILTRLAGDRELINAFNMILHTLPGTPFAYYGEEIGMSDLTSENPPNAYRGIMQWSNTVNAGFTEGNSSTWIPLPDDYSIVNVKTQLAHGYEDPPIAAFSELLALRQEPSMQWGDLSVGIAGKVLFYVRQAEGFGGYLVAINFGPGADTVDFVQNSPKEGLVPAEAEVVLGTKVDKEHYAPGVKVDMANLLLQEKQGVLFKWGPK